MDCVSEDSFEARYVRGGLRFVALGDGVLATRRERGVCVQPGRKPRLQDVRASSSSFRGSAVR